MFRESGFTITIEGNRHLGAALGLASFVDDFDCHKVDEWREEAEKLAAVAGSQPEAVYAAFMHDTRNKWNYVCRAVAK